ncbi:hypothetical protein ABIQ69_11020 [Agromyces sp. G08B096]|uniref:DUF4232 domain-containing protein n=1 Tax=Agromyces sp. G08B096 TaxID=3156399 RepID=A0AAU7W479_9MICO
MSAPDPDDLRESLRRAADAAPEASLRIDDVLDGARRARRRRRAAIAGGTASVAALIAAAGLAGGLAGLGPSPASDSTVAISGTPEAGLDATPQADEEAAAGVAPQDEPPFSDDRVGVDLLFRCGEAAPPATTAADASAGGLLVSVRATGPVRPGGTGDAVVTVTNTGSEPVAGVVAAPIAVAVVDGGGTVVWRSDPLGGEGEGRSIGLAAGEAAEIPVSFTAGQCVPGEAPGAEAALLDPGAYAVAAAVVVTAPDRPGLPLIAVSAAAPLTVG